MKNQIIYPIVSLLLGVCVVIALYLITQASQPKNNFKRLFKPNSLNERKVLDLRYNSYYLAGVTEEYIYLSNVTSPDSLLVTNYSLTDSQRIGINIPDDKKLAWAALNIVINYPNIYVMEGKLPTILNARFPELKYERSNLNNVRFFKSVPVATSSFVLTSYNSKIRQTVLTKVSTDPLSLNEGSYALEKQVDGIFCSSGILLYNRALDQLIYIYFYRGQFLGLDSDLELLYKASTIDTVDQANIKVDTITSDHKTVLNGHSTMVNQYCATDKSWLFIQSKLIADNETQQEFNNNSVIDVYSLKNKNYQFSFYLPNYRGKKMRNFAVCGTQLVAMHGQYLVTYSLNENQFKNKLDTLQNE